MTPDITERLARALERTLSRLVNQMNSREQAAYSAMEIMDFSSNSDDDVLNARAALAAYRQERPKS